MSAVLVYSEAAFSFLLYSKWILWYFVHRLEVVPFNLLEGNKMNFEIAPNVWLAVIAISVAVPILWFFNRRAKSAVVSVSDAGIQSPIQEELPGITRTTVASHPLSAMVIRPRYTPDKTVFVCIGVGIITGFFLAIVVLDFTGHLH